MLAHFLRSPIIRCLYVLLAALLLLVPQRTQAQSQLSASPGFVEEVVINDLPPATAVAFGPEGRIYLALKDGIVRVVQGGTLLATPFIDISSMTNRRTDRGLGGIALDPLFPTRPYVYLFFTYDPPELPPDDTTPRVSRLIRVQADPARNFNVALSDSTEIILGKNSTAQNTASRKAVGTTIVPEPASCMTGLTMDGTPIEDCLPSDELSHSAGTLTFGPDGMLYASHGDGAPYDGATKVSLRSQLLDSLAGKILRIDPNTGRGVADNPFYNPSNPNSNRSKVWAYGLRNPFRITVNSANGQVYIGDVGTSNWEEVNVGKGANFGWPCYEGGNTTNDVVGNGNTVSLINSAYRNLSRTSAFCSALYNLGLGAVVAPLFAYKHPVDANGKDLGGSITGVAFYQGASYPSQYRDALFIADYAQRSIRYLTFDQRGFPTVNSFALETSPSAGPVQLIIGPDTNLYALFLDLVTRKSQLRRYRYTSSTNTPPTVTVRADPAAGAVPLTVTFNTNGTNDPDGQALSYSWDFGDGSGAGETSPNPIHTYQTVGTFEATVVVRETTAPFAESAASITVRTGVSPPKVYITSPSPDKTYSIGEKISFSGYAEFDGVRAPDSALTWAIVQEHNLHEHLVDEIQGVSSGSFVTSEHSDNTRFVVCLSATVEGGLADQGCVTIQPRTTDVTFLSEPLGASIAYVDEEIEVLTPYVARPVVQSQQTIVAAATHQGRSFSRWSDGETNRQRSFTVGASPQTFTALYENQAPQAKISAIAFAGVAPFAVTLSADTSSDPDGGGLQYLWDFGEGDLATASTVTKTFNQPGQYRVSLRVTDSLGLFSEVSKDLVVYDPATTNTPPVVVAPLPETVRVGTNLILNGGVSDDGLPTGIVETRWSRVRGSTSLQFSSPQLPSTGISTSTVGTYLVKLEATDSVLRGSQNTVATFNPSSSTFGVSGFSLMNAATDEVIPGYENISNGAIIALSSLGTTSINIRANTVGSGVKSVVFLQDAVASSTDDVGPYSIAPDSSGDYPAWPYTTKRYLITAVPYSGLGGTGTQGDALSIQFTLRTGGLTNAAPTARIQAAPNAGSSPLVVSFDGSASTDPQRDPLRYVWDFGGGATSTRSIVSALFREAGTYPVTLTVSDPSGLSASATTTIQVGALVEPTQTPEATATPSPTPRTPVATVTPIVTPTRTPTSTPTRSVTGTPSTTPTAVVTPSASPTPMISATPTATPQSSTNIAPFVDPGLAQTVVLGSPITLNGVVTDDGLPSGALSIKWSRVRGPLSFLIAQPEQAVTSASAGESGTYLLKLEATDTLLRSAKNGLVTVNQANTSFGVTGLALINVATGQPFAGYENIPNGATINLSGLGATPQINVRANVSGSEVTSVSWLLDAAPLSTDSVAPFSIAPGSGSSYPAWAYTKGLYRVTAVPFSGTSVSSTQGAALSIQFSLR